MAKYADCVHGRNSAFCVMGCDPIPIPEKAKPAKKASLARPRKPIEVAEALGVAEPEVAQAPILSVASSAAKAPQAAKPVKVAEPETEQMVLNDICDLLQTPRRPLKPGEGVPKQVMQVAQGRLGLGYKVSAETAEMIVRKGAVTWDPAYVVNDEDGEPTAILTIDGARALRKALAQLLR